MKKFFPFLVLGVMFFLLTACDGSSSNDSTSSTTSSTSSSSTDTATQEATGVVVDEIVYVVLVASSEAMTETISSVPASGAEPGIARYTHTINSTDGYSITVTGTFNYDEVTEDIDAVLNIAFDNYSDSGGTVTIDGDMTYSLDGDFDSATSDSTISGAIAGTVTAVYQGENIQFGI